MWALGESTGGQTYFWFNPDKDKLPSATNSPLNSCNIHQSFWSLIALCFDLVMQKSICIFILCCLIISCFLSVLLCTLLSITPECIHVLLRLRSSSFLACHRLSRVTSLADMWSSYLPDRKAHV